MDLLCGKWDRRVDAWQNKWRLALPSSTREVFSKGVFLKEGKDGCVQVCPVNFAKIKDFSSIFIEKLENGGRIIIPECFRVSTSFFFGRNVTIAGNGDHLVLWPRPENN